MPEFEAASAPSEESEATNPGNSQEHKTNSETIKNVTVTSPDDNLDQAGTSSEPKEEWLDVLGSGDLKVKTLVEGETGTRPITSDLCTIKLKGELENGEVVEEFDELVVELNGSEVIQGLDLVLSLLDVGQKVTVILKPRFAYGVLGLPPKIPPNATIIYTIEMLNVQHAPDVTNVTFEDRKKRAQYKKDRGNWWYSRGDAQKAIQCYRPALELLQASAPYHDDEGNTTEMPQDVFQDCVKLRLVIYNNMAAAQLMIDAYDSALVSVENVISLEPNNVKALFRKGKILAAKGNTEEAVEVFTKVSALEPENNAVRKELNLALKRQAKEKIQAKNLYRKMLGGEKEQGEEPKTADVVSRAPRSKWTKFLGGAAAATVTIVIAYGFGFKYKSLWE